MERAMRFELTTSTLARLRSTPELRPHRVSADMFIAESGANIDIEAVFATPFYG